MPKTIKQKVIFTASPREVYDALMSSRTHAKFTGSAAHISRRVGGKFTAYGGYLEGVNLKLVPGAKIVQSWREDRWPEGRYSRATFALKRVKKGTALTFTQAGVPDKFLASIRKGWVTYYWKPMERMFRSAAGRK